MPGHRACFGSGGRRFESCHPDNYGTIGFFPIRDVAQPGSAHAWGAWGRRFKSCHPDQITLYVTPIHKFAISHKLPALSAHFCYLDLFFGMKKAIASNLGHQMLYVTVMMTSGYVNLTVAPIFKALYILFEFYPYYIIFLPMKNP